MKSDRIAVNGKVYKLQHPGNREWIKLKGSLYSGQKDSFNFETMLDYCFENVVFPESGSQLTLDTVDTVELEEVWAVILPMFLRGKLDAGYVYPDSGKDNKEGRRILQESSKE